MIYRYRLQFKSSDEQRLRSDDAYRLYAWLLSQLPEEYGDELHIQQEHPISHYLLCEAGKSPQWIISILSDDANQLLQPVLCSAREIALNNITLLVEQLIVEPPVSPKDLVLAARSKDSSRAALVLHAPTTFKQNGSYVMFPQELLVVRSLINRWNCFCPDFPLNDEEAFQMLLNGIRITDYNLHSKRYRLKGTLICGFCGKLTLSARLPLPLQELWSVLLLWAPYSGIGIKTALGMGGTSVQFSENDTIK